MILYITDAEESAISTIVIRGSTDNVMDDIERAIDDGVNTFKALTKVQRYMKTLTLQSDTVYREIFYPVVFSYLWPLLTLGKFKKG